MSKPEKPRCAGSVATPGGWSRIPCRKTGILEHDGKHYCKLHHPPTRKAKAAATEARWKAEWATEAELRVQQQAAKAEQKRRADCFDEMLTALRKAVVALAGACVHSPELGADEAYEAVSEAIAKATGAAQ